MKPFAAIIALLLMVPVGFAQTVKLPTEVKGDPNTFIIIKSETDCKELRWLVLDSGLSMMPPELLKDSRTAVVIAGRPGRYRVLAYGALKDTASEPAVCVVVLGEVPPVPPVPPKPDPDDPLLGVLSAAYHADVSDRKAEDIKQLAAIYRQAAKDTVRRPEITTLAMIQSTMKKAITGLIEERLGGVRQSIGAELRKTLPTEAEAILDTVLRDKVAKEFDRIGRTLEQVK